MKLLALVGQLATTLPLVGLIWMVQVVAYPLFERVAAAEFPAGILVWVVVDALSTQ